MADTALSLVNELLALQRLPAVSSTLFLTDPSSVVALKLVNEGIESILNSKTWDFAIRHDGFFTTNPSLTETVDVTEDSQAFEITATLTGDTKDYVTTSPNVLAPVRYLVVTGDATYPNTPWKIRQTTPTASTTIPGWFDYSWEGATGSGVACTLVAPEYVFPPTVRDVISATANEIPVRIDVVAPSARLDQIIPRPTDTINDSPEFFAIGGSASPQNVGSSLVPELEPRLRGFLFPIPDTRYPVTYSYVIRYEKLLLNTDELSGVSEAAKNEVIKYAEARFHIGPGNDPDLGRALKLEGRVDTAEAMIGAERGTSRRSSIEPFNRARSRLRTRDRYVGNIEGL